MLFPLGVASTVDWSSIISAETFNPMIEQVTSVMPVIIGFAVTVIGIRFVWKFIKGQIKRP